MPDETKNTCGKPILQESEIKEEEPEKVEIVLSGLSEEVLFKQIKDEKNENSEPEKLDSSEKDNLTQEWSFVPNSTYNKMTKCTECDVNFERISDLREHFSACHDGKNQRSFEIVASQQIDETFKTDKGGLIPKKPFPEKRHFRNLQTF